MFKSRYLPNTGLHFAALGWPVLGRHAIFKKKRSYTHTSWYVQKLIPARYWFGVWTTLAGQGETMITTRFEANMGNVLHHTLNTFA
jgi:hypothetical protein